MDTNVVGQCYEYLHPTKIQRKSFSFNIYFGDCRLYFLEAILHMFYEKNW